MRSAIRAKLQTITDVGGRVMDPHVAGPQTVKPYIIIREGAETEDSPWSGFRRIVEVWPYVDETNFQEVDALVKKVKDTLEKQLLTDLITGEVFTCRYAGSDSQDYVDRDWKALTRCLRFEVYALQAVTITETVSDDPWLTAMSNYTKTILDSKTWTTYQNFWPLGYKVPSVMWRLVSVEIKSASASLFEVKKRIVGHVIGSTPNQEIVGVVSLVQAAGRDVKIVTDSINNRYMTVKSVMGDYLSDALTKGQITMNLSMLTSKPMEEVSLIEEVYINGKLK